MCSIYQLLLKVNVYTYLIAFSISFWELFRKNVTILILENQQQQIVAY